MMWWWSVNKRIRKKKAKQAEERMLSFVVPILDPYGNSGMSYKQKMKYLKAEVAKRRWYFPIDTTPLPPLVQKEVERMAGEIREGIDKDIIERLLANEMNFK